MKCLGIRSFLLYMAVILGTAPATSAVTQEEVGNIPCSYHIVTPGLHSHRRMLIGPYRVVQYDRYRSAHHQNLPQFPSMQAAKRLQAAIDSAAVKYSIADWQQNQEWLRVVEMSKHATLEVSIVQFMISILPLLIYGLGPSQAPLISTALSVNDR